MAFLMPFSAAKNIGRHVSIKCFTISTYGAWTGFFLAFFEAMLYNKAVMRDAGLR
jgi:hypothetical protein